MKNKPLKEITQVIFFTAVVFFSAYYFVPGVAEAIDNVTEGYRLVPDVTRSLTIHGVQCKYITAGGSRDIFLPTKSYEEYNAFLSHKPSDVTVTDCPVPDTCETENVTWGGETYTGVRMGNQCWMDRNLNYGTLLGDQEPDDNGVVEKMCPGNVESGCDKGALYRSGEAFNYDWDAPGTQGICPPGWHIPTVEEVEFLLESIGATGSDRTYKTVREGLVTYNFFNGKYAGTAVWALRPPSTLYWNYVNIDSIGIIMSSSCYLGGQNSTNCYYLELDSTRNDSYPTPSPSTQGSYRGNSVRCIKGIYTAPPPIQ